MKSRIGIETLVGLFMIAGFACAVYLTVKLGDVPLLANQTYELSALFSSTSGLKKGAQVEISGVKVGKVASIGLDPVTYSSVIKMAVEQNVKIPEDTIASIKTAGIIGDKYVELKPGASETYLKSGEKIRDTEGSLDLEGLVSKYIFEKKE